MLNLLTCSRCSCFISAILFAAAVGAADWPTWRGPDHGVAVDSPLPASWTPGGENSEWRADFCGRSTPIVLGNRVCTNGRVGTTEDRAEIVACFQADNGARLWQQRVPVALSTVPFNRASWGSLEGDPETGYVYHQGVGGTLLCLDRDGNRVWQRSLHEEVGRFSGYGGRTASPTIFEDALIVNMINTSFGSYGPPRHRYYAFEKRTGAILWTANPAGPETDKNTQSTIAVARIGARDLLVSGNADGAIYALDARTGAMRWKFQLSKRGLNSTVAIHGDTVFAGHSEENVDVGTMGRVVAIDGTGTGDVTLTHERWRLDGIGAGFASPTWADGKLYVTDNAAKLHALAATSGKLLWTASLGTVGKGSPVIADGKLFATEVNGAVVILDATTGAVLDRDRITTPDDRPAEIYASPAIAEGRVFIATEAGIYAIGNSGKPRPSAKRVEPATTGKVAPVEQEPAIVAILLTPAEVLMKPGEAIALVVTGYSADGRRRGVEAAKFTLAAGLNGEILEGARFRADPATPFQIGVIEARVGEHVAQSRVRVVAPLPWRFDFETTPVGKSIPFWIGTSRYVVADKNGGRVLTKPALDQGLARSSVYFGPATLANYTIESRVRGTFAGRRVPDIGLINSGYTLDLLGSHQRLQIRSWDAVLRIDKTIDFAWSPAVWYRMKFRVATVGDHAEVRGKVWPADAVEPSEWSIAVDDPHPIVQGSPGLAGFSSTEIDYDDIVVRENP